MTVQEFMAEQIERIGESLAHFIETTDPDKQTWKPLVPGSAPTRSALEQAGECVATNRYFAALLRGETIDMPAGGAKPQALSDAQDARTHLTASCNELATAVRGLEDEALGRSFSHWRGPVSGKKLLIGAYRNMAYHAGQINLLQILGGDAEFHVPPTWY